MVPLTTRRNISVPIDHPTAIEPAIWLSIKSGSAFHLDLWARFRGATRFLMERTFVYGRNNQGGPTDFSGLGGGQYITRVTRRVYVTTSEPPNDLLPKFEPFRKFHNDFSPMLPTFGPPMTAQSFYNDSDYDSPPSPPTKAQTHSPMTTQHPYHHDDYLSSYPSKSQPSNITHGYHRDESSTLTSKAVQPKMMHHGYYHDEPSRIPAKGAPPMMTQPQYQPHYPYSYEPPTYPGRYDHPGGGNPINLNVNLYWPQDLNGRYPGNGNYNGQTGGGPYNPQVQRSNKLGGDGKVNMGPEVNGANLNIGEGNAGGGNIGGKKKKKKKKKDEDSSSDDEDRVK